MLLDNDQSKAFQLKEAQDSAALLNTTDNEDGIIYTVEPDASRPGYAYIHVTDSDGYHIGYF